MGKILHMCLDVRGALNWPKHKLKGMLKTDSGKKLTPDEVRTYLMDCLADGSEVIPIGTDCTNFDKKLGCQCYK